MLTDPAFSLRLEVVVTNNGGANGRPVAEWVIMSMMYFLKNVPRLVENQRRRGWDRQPLLPDGLAGKTVGTGLGSIGQLVAHFCRGFGMRVPGTRRNITAPVADVDTLVPLDRIGDLLRASDFVVLAVPLTGETAGRINADTLRQMRSEAVLINPSRGPIVDEAALIAALEGQLIAGAALDVFAEEPLPPTNPLWTMPNVHQPACRGCPPHSFRHGDDRLHRKPAALPRRGTAAVRH